MEQLEVDNKNIDSRLGWRAKQELIRSIQEKQGGAPCFQTGKEYCDRYDCCWRKDCQP